MNVAIIGTAGRKDDAEKLDKSSFTRMTDATIFILNSLKLDLSSTKVISGGAAWADHIAVELVLKGLIVPENLTLYLPTDLGEFAFYGKDMNSDKSANIANYYHSRFSNVIKRDSIQEIIEVGKRGTILVPGDGIFHSRNSDVAKSVIPDGVLIAFTFGDPKSTQPEWTARQFYPNTSAKEAGLKDGGTADTWKKAKCVKFHVRLGEST